VLGFLLLEINNIMKIHDILTQQISEGPNDPHIFKAVFLAGGPGSGKSFVANKLLSGTGLRPINSDDIYEYLMQKQGMDMADPDTIASPAGQETREKAKQITKNREAMYLDGRLGVIIDGTGKDVEKVKKAQASLKELGYDTMMLFVNTSLDVAQQRNQMRPRRISAELVTKMWNAVQQNIMKFQQIFGAANFHVVDNSGGLEDADRAANFNKIDSEVRKFINSPPANHNAKQWLSKNKQ
jgi:cytidylate kinase